MAVSTDEIGTLICKAIGIDPNKTNSITLKLKAGELVKIEVVQTPGGNEMQEVAKILKAYRWEEE